MPGTIIYLARLLGRRAFLAFCTVSILVVGLLAAVNMASSHALKEYVEDQLGRIPWDITAYQMTEVRAVPEVGPVLEQVSGIMGRENILFLRTNPTAEDRITVDGEPLRATWISLLTSTRMEMLPSDWRPIEPGKSVLILIGSKSQMGDAYTALQDKQQLAMTVGDMNLPVFNLPLERVVRIEGREINRWFLDQTSSPTMMPEIGLVLVTPFDSEVLTKFDTMARGGMGRAAGIDLDEMAGQYLPDIIHVLQVDRPQLISGWDIGGSLGALSTIQEQLSTSVLSLGPTVFLDNTTRILLDRMNETAERVGLISLLVSLPLLWMGWILLANLSRLLLLNERRKFGLLRLRGVSGLQMGRALQLAIGAGALIGGLLGGVLGTVLPMLYYEGALLPLELILKVQQPLLLGGFIAIGMAISLLVSRRLVRYVSRISPLEASGRVAISESDEAGVRFGLFEGLALGLGTFKVIAWITGFSLTTLLDAAWVSTADRGLDFVGFPLFVYGVVSLLASRRTWLKGALQVSVRAVGGPLRQPILQHISTRPHRIAGFLLIVALMTTISLYPTIMSAVFNDKIERGARVQLGSDLQLSINAADMVSNELLANGGLAGQYQAIAGRMDELLGRVREVPGVVGATYMVEGVSEGVFVPGYGYNGLPIYLVPDAEAFLSVLYHEEPLAEGGAFSATFSRIEAGEVLLSPSVAAYSRRNAGDPALLGRTTDRLMLQATVGGILRYLPGSPLSSITDKDSFASARIDYVNHLFNNNAYIVADPSKPQFGNLDVLVTGVHLAVDTADGIDQAAVAATVTGLLPAQPLSVRTISEELGRVGTDMYVFLARANVQVYLVGGLLLALIGILSIAYANYLEDRRTLGLLRIRGVGPGRMLQFFGSGLFAPALIGLVLGIAVSLVVGYGMTNLVWELRAVQNILIYLATHLTVSGATLAIAALIVALLLAVGLAFSQWVFRNSARQGLSDT